MIDSEKTNLQSERLVAYLDGELTAEQSEAVEEQLAADAELREELGQFDRVWSLLDFAPRPSATPVFSGSTVAMIATVAGRDVAAQTAALPVVRRRQGGRTTLMALSAAVLAFGVVRGVASRVDRQLLVDLPVIQQAAVLRQMDSLDFLRQVRKKTPRLVASIEGWDLQHVPQPSGTSDHQTPSEQSGDRPLVQEVETWEWLTEASPAMRAEWIAQLSPAEREELAGKATAFRSLSPHSARRLRELDAELRLAEDGTELRRTALAYHTLVSTQSAGEQAAILALPPEERIVELRRKWRAWSEEALVQLSAAEQAHFREVVLALAATPSVQAVVDRWIERLQNHSSQRGRPVGHRAERLRQHPEGILFLAANGMAREGPWGNHSPQSKKLRDYPKRPEHQKVGGRVVKELWPVWEAELIKGLPERLREPIKKLAPPRRAKLLRTQLIESAAPARPSDAKQFFAELSGEEQRVLLALPADQMQQKLREKMADDRMGLRQLERMWRGDSGRRGGPPHRGR